MHMMTYQILVLGQNTRGVTAAPVPGFGRESGIREMLCDRGIWGRRCGGGSRCFYSELGFEESLYTPIYTSNGPKFPDIIQWWKIIGPSSCQPTSRAVPRLALRAGVEAQARHYERAVPGTGPMGAGSCRAWSVLFWAVPMLAQRAWPIWPSIALRRKEAVP